MPRMSVWTMSAYSNMDLEPVVLEGGEGKDNCSVFSNGFALSSARPLSVSCISKTASAVSTHSFTSHHSPASMTARRRRTEVICTMTLSPLRNAQSCRSLIAPRERAVLFNLSAFWELMPAMRARWKV